MLNNILVKTQAEIAEALYASAQANAGTTEGLLVPVAPGTYDYQPISVVRNHYSSTSKPQDPDVVLAVAEILSPMTKNIPEQLDELNEKTSVIDDQIELIRSGQNMVLGTDHLTLLDIAFFGAIHSARLKKGGAQHRSILIASKAVDYMAVDTKSFNLPPDIIKDYLENLGLELQEDGTVPVRDFLGIAFDELYLSIPSTGSFTDLRKIQSEAVAAHNGLVKEKLRRSTKVRAKKLPTSLYIAMSGTKTKLLDRGRYKDGAKVPNFYRPYPPDFNLDQEVEVIGRFSPAVLGFLGNALTYAATLRLGEEQSTTQVAIDQHPIALRDPEDLERYGEKLVGLVNSINNGPLTIYDSSGNLPTYKKTA